MKIYTCILILLAGAILAGCGGGGGAGAGSGSAASVQSESGLTQERKLGAGSREDTTIDMPAAPLIVEALRFYNDDMNAPPVSVRAFDLAGLPLFTDKNPLIEKTLNVLKSNKAVMAVYKASEDWTLRPAIAAAIDAGDTVKARALIRMLYLATIPAAVADPSQGWEVEGNEKMGQWCDLMEQMANFTTQMEAAIASKVHARLLQDPEEAKLAVLRAFAALNPADVAAMWDQFTPSKSTVFDETGKCNGACWKSDNGRFEWGSEGLVWRKNGVTWFGEGRMFGKQYSLQLASTVSHSLARSSHTTESQNATTGTTSSTATQE